MQLADEVSWVPSAAQTETFLPTASIRKFNIAAIPGVFDALME